MINTHRRWSRALIFGSAVVLLVGTGLTLITRHDVRAIASPVVPSAPPPQLASPAVSETVPQWSDWDDLGGSFNAGPSVAAWSVNRLDVFLRGSGQTMLHRAYNGTKWYPVENLGPSVLGGPGAVARGPDRIDIFVRGADNQLWQKKWNGGWMGYFPLGGFLTSSPAVSSWAPNRLDVFVRGSDNALYHKSWDGIGWNG